MYYHYVSYENLSVYKYNLSTSGEGPICFPRSTIRFRYLSIPIVPKSEKSGEMELRSLPSRMRDDSFITGVPLSLAFHCSFFFNALIAAVLCTYIGSLYLFS